jgi:hypothetical protein
MFSETNDFGQFLRKSFGLLYFQLVFLEFRVRAMATIEGIAFT